MKLTVPGIYMARLPTKRGQWSPTSYYWFYKQMEKGGKKFHWRAVPYVDHPVPIRHSVKAEKLVLRSNVLSEPGPKFSRFFPATIPYEEGAI